MAKLTKEQLSGLAQLGLATAGAFLPLSPVVVAILSRVAKHVPDAADAVEVIFAKADVTAEMIAEVTDDLETFRPSFEPPGVEPV